MPEWDAPTLVSHRFPTGLTGTRTETGMLVQTGVIKWFNPAKGYGFITTSGGEDIFLHHSNLEQQHDRRFSPGDHVLFDIVSGERGLKAINVSRVESPDENAKNNPLAELDEALKNVLESMSKEEVGSEEGV